MSAIASAPAPSAIEPADSYLTCSDIERKFRVSRRTVARWIAAGILPAPLRMGYQRYWERDQIAGLFSRDKRGGPA